MILLCPVCGAALPSVSFAQGQGVADTSADSNVVEIGESCRCCGATFNLVALGNANCGATMPTVYANDAAMILAQLLPADNWRSETCGTCEFRQSSGIEGGYGLSERRDYMACRRFPPQRGHTSEAYPAVLERTAACAEWQQRRAK